MATCHGGTGCQIDRDANLHVEETEAVDTDNDNESISGSDNTVALGGWETEIILMNFYPATRLS